MYIIDFKEYLFEAKTSGYTKLRSLGFTIRIRCCCSKYESIKGIKKLRLEVYNRKEHDCTKYGVTSNKTMMSSCKLVVLFETGIPLKHNVLMCYSKIINISLKVMINDWLILENIIVYQRLFLSSRSFQRINQKFLFNSLFSQIFKIATVETPPTAKNNTSRKN